MMVKFELPAPITTNRRLNAVILGASEYLSRFARYELASMCVSEIGLAQAQQGVKISNVKTFASLMGVSTRTVERWTSGDIQSNNMNAEKLLRQALRLNRVATLEILRKEQEKHSKLNGELDAELRGLIE